MKSEKAHLPRLSPGILSRRIQAALSLIAALCISGTVLSGCGSGFNYGIAAQLYSPASTVRVNDTVQLETNTQLTGSPVVFSVNGVPGGNAQWGTVDSKGVYTAPAIVPTPSNAVTITATAPAFPNATPGTVTLNIWNPIPVVASATPSTFAEGTELVTVQGSQFVYGAQIYWNGVAVPTTYISGTQLAASLAAPSPGTYQLSVTNPNPGSANSQSLPESVGPGQVVLTINSGNGTTVRVNNSLNLGITVNGTNNTGVTWSLNGTAKGNAQIGTIVANSDGSVTYTAPAVVPTPNNVVTLKATSVDNPAVSITQNISVFNPIPILNSATPMAFDPGVATTVVLNGSAFINGATVLANGVAVPTTFNNGGQLTASVNPANAGNLDLQVLNPSPGPAASTDLIALVNGTPPTLPVSPTDASRFLQQATFGATDADIHHLSQIGYTAWFNEQFAMPQTLHEQQVEGDIIVNNPACAAADATCNAALFLENANGQNYMLQSFWQQAITGDDQLRQRMKYVLSELMVVSSTNGAVGNMPRGMANYYDKLGADAFTNFRQILQDVTLSPVMGEFLNVLGNDKGDANRDPDENYAREVMQLLTIGLYQLNPDGTQMLDATGNPIPSYSNSDVMGLAKVFTGFSWNIPGEGDNAWDDCCSYVGTGYGEDILPMQSYPDHHSTDAKSFLGTNIAASSTGDPQGDLKIGLDTLFNHPNVGPFISKQLIEHLVTSNPSPAYVGRVAAVFADNGSGVRGDMKAVIQAILMDDEARNATNAAANPQYGKVNESLVRYTQWARAFTAESRNGSFNIGSTQDRIHGLGEMATQSPSVFNWFAPGYTPPGTSIAAAGLLAPEMEMTDVSTVVGYLNYMQGAIGSSAQNGSDIYSSYSTEVGLAANPDALLDRINLLLMAGTMDATLRAQILAAVNSIAIPASGADAINTALTSRAQIAIYLTMASPSFAGRY